MLKAFVPTLTSFMLLHFLLSALVSSQDTLKPGEILDSSSYLYSAQSTFKLSFYAPDRINLGYLAIFYAWHNIDEVPVWIGNRNTPVPSYSSVLTITNEGKLLITHRRAGTRANPIVLYAAKPGTNISATLLDSGNFVVKEIWPNGSSHGEILWQSFDYPTDVYLPGMKLGINHRTGRNWTLTSWVSNNNPASGAFTLHWDPIRGRVVVSRRGIVRWTSWDFKPYFEGSNLNFHAFDGMRSMPHPEGFNYKFINVSNQDEEYLTVSILEHALSGGDYTSGLPPHHSGWRLDSNGNIKHMGGVFLDVDKCYGNTRRGVETGCELWETPTCRKSSSIALLKGYFAFNIPFTYNPNLSYSDCRETCWEDCNCIGFAEQNGCMNWKGKFEDFIDHSRVYGGPSIYVITTKKRRVWLWIPILVVLLSVLGLSYFVVKKLRKQRRGRRKKTDDLKDLKEILRLDGYTEVSEFENGGGTGTGRASDLKHYTYASILASTNCFSLENKLGEGGFGPVYKGKMSDGHEIAIKLLSRRSEQGLVEFKTELVLISNLQHRNLVKLSGFCIHQDEKMIIYDYMPNGSLDRHLFDLEKRRLLNWEKRFHIIEGIAQGLLYLHKYSRITIVHRDLKASNILLDSYMNPKISDFGMARIFRRNAAEVNTRKCAGTYGYMAPEYAMQGLMSVKCDIYSFGVMMLEIVSGRRNNSFQHLEGPHSLVELAWELSKESAELELMDSLLKDSVSSMKDQVRRCIQLSLLCVENEAVDRPLIEDVILMMKTESMVLPTPKKPAFLLRNEGVQKLRQSKPERYSKNSFSVSVMDGR